MIELIQNNTVLLNIALTLIHFLWQGIAIAVLLKIALLLTPESKSTLRYGYGLTALLANAVLPILTFITLYTSEQLQNGTTIVSELTNSAQTLNSTNNIQWYNSIAEYLPYITLGWMITVVILAGKLVTDIFLVQHLPKQQAYPAPDNIQTKFIELSKRIGLTTPPKLLISLKVNVPMAIGWLKPVVMIPASMLTGLTPKQLDMLMLHELAHIKRYDYLVNILQSIVELLLFFHPAVSWVSKQVRDEREYCSDDIAVQHCGNAIAYARTLTDTASLCLKHRTHSVSTMAMAASGGDLKQRVTRLVNHHCSNHVTPSKWLAATTVLFGISFLSATQLSQINITKLLDSQLALIFQSKSKEQTIVEPLKSAVQTSSIAQQLLAQQTQPPPVEAQSIIQPSMEYTETYIDFSSGKTENIDSKRFEEPKVINDDSAQEQTVSITHNTETFRQTDNLEDKLANTKARNQEFSKTAITDITPPVLKKALPTPNKYTEQIANFEQEPLGRFESLVNQEISQPQSNNSLTVSEPEVINKAPELLYSVQPKYPSNAKRRGIELDVVVNFTIDANGQVKNLKIENKRRAYYFRKAIRSAMEKWRFKPATVNNKPVASQMRKIFAFHFDN